MTRERSLAPEEEHEMLYGYPVVYTEDATDLGCSGDLEFVAVSELEKHCQCSCPRVSLGHAARTVQQICRDCIGGPTWQDRVRALKERIAELMSPGDAG